MTDAITVDKEKAQQSSPLAKMTVLEREKAQKKLEQENVEEILQTGQENRKAGIKATQQINDSIQEKRTKHREDILTDLESKRSLTTSYQNTLARSLADILSLIEWLPRWHAEVIATTGSPITIKGRAFKTQEGILLVVFPPDGAVLHRGITMTRNPVLDYAAVYNLAMQAENTMDEYRKHFEVPRQPEGILDQYGKPTQSKPILRA